MIQCTPFFDVEKSMLTEDEGRPGCRRVHDGFGKNSGCGKDEDTTEDTYIRGNERSVS